MPSSKKLKTAIKAVTTTTGLGSGLVNDCRLLPTDRRSRSNHGPVLHHLCNPQPKLPSNSNGSPLLGKYNQAPLLNKYFSAHPSPIHMKNLTSATVPGFSDMLQSTEYTSGRGTYIPSYYTRLEGYGYLLPLPLH